MGQARIVVCGEALFDFFQVPTDDPADAALHFEARAGGSPFNVARTLAGLGTGAAFLSGVSTDFLGAELVAILEAEGIATEFVHRSPAPTTVSLVDETVAGAPNYSFLGNGAADRSLQVAELPAELGDAAGLHFGSYSLVAEPAAGTYLQLARREAGQRLLSLDPNVRLNVEPELAVWHSRVEEFRQCADIVKTSVEDLAHLAPGMRAEQVAADWLQSGNRLVAITRGGEGAAVWTESGHATTAAVPVQVVDTVGAGDAFQAGLLHYIVSIMGASRNELTSLTETDLAAALRFASAAAAVVCTARGANPPAMSTVKALLNEVAQ